MRLTCPNCGARYEVADSMIPAEGRDVQCSNCSTTWYQPGRRTDKQAELDPGIPTPPAAPDVPDVQAPQPEPQDPAANPADAPAGDTARAEHDAGQGGTTPPAPPPRREIDPAIRDILRAEAEREARLRQADAGPVETQDEMPLSDAPAKADLRPSRTELDSAVDVFAADATAAQRPVAARDLFPDIEQINSTLRDTGDRSNAELDASDVDTLDAAPRRRQGTRLGFVLAMMLAAAAAALYGNAEWVSARMPQVAPLLDSYLAGVDAARFWLDDMAQRLAALGAAAGGDQN